MGLYRDIIHSHFYQVERRSKRDKYMWLLISPGLFMGVDTGDVRMVRVYPLPISHYNEPKTLISCTYSVVASLGAPQSIVADPDSSSG